MAQQLLNKKDCAIWENGEFDENPAAMNVFAT
jgi:hypothetical protein